MLSSSNKCLFNNYKFFPKGQAQECYPLLQKLKFVFQEISNLLYFTGLMRIKDWSDKNNRTKKSICDHFGYSFSYWLIKHLLSRAFWGKFESSLPLLCQLVVWIFCKQIVSFLPCVVVLSLPVELLLPKTLVVSFVFWTWLY